jgi:hypothetical protein
VVETQLDRLFGMFEQRSAARDTLLPCRISARPSISMVSGGLVIFGPRDAMRIKLGQIVLIDRPRCVARCSLSASAPRARYRETIARAVADIKKKAASGNLAAT